MAPLSGYVVQNLLERGDKELHKVVQGYLAKNMNLGMDRLHEWVGSWLLFFNYRFINN